MYPLCDKSFPMWAFDTPASDIRRRSWGNIYFEVFIKLKSLTEASPRITIRALFLFLKYIVAFIFNAARHNNSYRERDDIEIIFQDAPTVDFSPDWEYRLRWRRAAYDTLPTSFAERPFHDVKYTDIYSQLYFIILPPYAPSRQDGPDYSFPELESFIYWRRDGWLTEKY